jgi:hypothetical protein
MRDKNIKTFNFHGDKMERKDDILLFETYQTVESDNIQRIKIPELIEIDPISRELANKEDLLPKTLDIFLGMVLKHK